MGINKNVAVPACDTLFKRGLILKNEYEKLLDETVRGVTLKGHVLDMLGSVIGPFWLREEIAEYRLVLGSILDPLSFSFAEWMVSQMDARFPWHDGEGFLGGGIQNIFVREAAEPWHWGLSFDNIPKHELTTRWFDEHASETKMVTEKILVMAYGWKEETV